MLAAVLLAAGGISMIGGGCAGQAEVVRVTSEFTEQDAEIFDDGIDFVADPGAIGGSWEQDWQEDLERRVGASDFIGTITVETIRTDVDLDRRETIHLVAQVDDRIFGKAPGRELELSVRSAQPGYTTVEGNDRRILNQPFVAFVKWYRAEGGDVKPHWHLAPATPAVVEQTRALANRRRETPEGQRTRTRVIVHEQ